MPEPLTLAGLTIATLAALPAELIGQSLGSGISRGTRGLLRILRRQPGELPVNHDLQRATGEALEKALGLLAKAVQGRQAECEKAEHRHWCDLFVELARNRRRVSEIDGEFSLEREELFEAVAAGGGAALEEKLGEAVLRWTRGQLEEGEGTSEPLWFAEMVRAGFDMPARTRNAGQAASLHQAFCEFFHEDLKSNERVFRIFTVFQNESIREGLADLAGGAAPSEGEVKEVRAALESQSIGSDKLMKFFGEETERIHRKLDALRAGQAEIREGVHKLAKIGAIALAVLALVGVGVWRLQKGQKELRTGQEELLAAHEKRDAEVRAFLERLNLKMTRMRSPEGLRLPPAVRYREALRLVAEEQEMAPEILQVRIESFVADVKARGEESSIYDRALAAFAEENYAEASALAERSVASARERLDDASAEAAEAQRALVDRLILRGQAAAEQFEWTTAIAAYEEAAGLLDREADGARWAAIQAEVAANYKEALDFENALKHAELAWEAQKAIDDNDPVTFRYGNMVGIVTMRLGKFKSAETIFQQSLREGARVLGRSHPDSLQTMDHLGSLMVLQGQTKKAQAWLKRAQSVAVAAQGEDGRATLRIRCRLGTVDTLLGNGKKAEADLRKVLSSQERLFGEEDVDTLLTKQALVAPLLGQSKFAETEEVARDLIKAWKKQSGPESHVVLECSRSLGSALAGQGKFDEAVRLLEWTLDVQERKLGRDHTDVLSTLALLLVSYRAKEDLDRANAIGERIVTTMDRILGPDHPEVLKLRITMGTSYADQGKFAEAETLCSAVLERIKGKREPSLAPVRAAAEALNQRILDKKSAR